MRDLLPATVACRCGQRSPVLMADSLHVSEAPERRAAILDGTLNRHACPGCGRVVQLEQLLAYTDFPRRHWFTVVPSFELSRRRIWVDFAEESFRSTMVTHAPPLVTTWSGEMRRRVIFGLPSLREKLVLADEGFDDRVIELAKLELRQELGLTDPWAYFFVTRRSSSFELVVESSELGRAGGTATVWLSVARCEELAAQGDVALQGRAPDLWNDVIVDLRALFIRDETMGDPPPPSVEAPLRTMGEPDPPSGTGG